MKKVFLMMVVLAAVFTAPTYAHGDELHTNQNSKIKNEQKIHSNQKDDTNKKNMSNNTANNEEYAQQHLFVTPKKSHSYMIPYVMVGNVLVLFLAGAVIYSERKKHFVFETN